MKMKIFICIYICFLTSFLYGGDIPASSDSEKIGFIPSEWTPIQISLGYPLFKAPCSIYGLGISLLSETNDIYGVNCSVFEKNNGNMIGLNLNFISLGTSSENLGVHITFVNINSFNNKANKGLSLNFIYSGKNEGLLLGGANISSGGTSVAIVNYSREDQTQVGMINCTKSGFQLGLLNYNENSIIPYFPLFNYSKLNAEKTINQDVIVTMP